MQSQNNNKKVLIFGGGIAGLTAAHELAEKGYKVTLVEKSPHLGGMAYSSRITNSEWDNLPTEHSWRAYLVWYHNFFNIAKRIPLTVLDSNSQLSKTVYDNLSKHYEFIMPKNDQIDPEYKSTPSVADWIKISKVSKALLGDEKHRAEYATKSFKDEYGDNLSQGGKDYMIHQIATGFGFDLNRASVYHVAKFIELDLESENDPDQKMRGMNAPTNEAWFNHWEYYLINHLGVDIRKGESLTGIEFSNSKSNELIINQCTTTKSRNDYNNSKYQHFIFCLNPILFARILNQSIQPQSINLQLYPNIYKSIQIAEEFKSKPHIQIGFQIAFNTPCKLPNQGHTVLTFPDSENNITLQFVEHFWNKDGAVKNPVLSDKSKITDWQGYDLGRHKSGEIKSLWSGTICYPDNPKHNMISKPLNIQKIKEELKRQIWYDCKQFQSIIKNENPDITDLMTDHLLGINLHFDYLSDPKFVDTTTTRTLMPSQKTKVSNMYIGGAHTKTSTDVWTMEAAVESGKLVAKAIHEPKEQLSNPDQEETPIPLYEHTEEKGKALFIVYWLELLVLLVIVVLGILISILYKKYAKQPVIQQPNPNPQSQQQL